MSGQQIDPGDPVSGDRHILTVAGDLRALAARAAELWERFKPIPVD